MESDQAVSLFHHINDLTCEKSVPEADDGSRFCLFSRLYQCLPHIVTFSFQKQYLNPCICSHLTSVQAGRNDLRVIDDKAVPRVQISSDMFKISMLDFSCFPVQMQQPGSGTVGKRVLRDQFLRQIIIKI